MDAYGRKVAPEEGLEIDGVRHAPEERRCALPAATPSTPVPAAWSAALASHDAVFFGLGNGAFSLNAR